MTAPAGAAHPRTARTVNAATRRKRCACDERASCDMSDLRLRVAGSIRQLRAPVITPPGDTRRALTRQDDGMRIPNLLAPLSRGSAAISPTAHYTGHVWGRNGLSHP